MEVRILPTAWEGLARIRYRVELDFGLETARRVTDGILNSLKRLEAFPDSGALTPDDWLNAYGFRMVVSGSRNVSLFRRVEDVIYVYLIADTRTEYVKVFHGMILEDPEVIAE